MVVVFVLVVVLLVWAVRLGDSLGATTSEYDDPASFGGWFDAGSEDNDDRSTGGDTEGP
jgi:hypothetical protein